MGIPDDLTCLLRNLCTDQEATVETGHGKTDGFQIGKGVYQGCILSPCLFNLYAEYIMWNAGLDESLLVRPLSLKQLTESRPASHSISWQVARARVRLLKHDPRPSRRRKAAHWSDLASSCVNCDVHITLHSFQETSHVHPWLIHVNACNNHHNTVIN